MELTDRQAEILWCIADGWSNKLIAAKFNISEQTVKNHISDILRRLRANNRAHAVSIAYHLGLLRLHAEVTLE